MRHLRPRAIVALLVTLGICTATSPISASGHGPLFGAATPVLGKGGWSFDAALMGRSTEDAIAQTLRGLISFGVTENLQVSLSLPLEIGTHPPMPGARVTAMMSHGNEVELGGGWRLHTRPVGIGGRLESTLFVAYSHPLDAGANIHEMTPALSVSAVTGYASRAHYFWIGAGHQQFLERNGDRPSNVTSYSVVYGYRPPAWRLDYPKPDVRIFGELVGERIGYAKHFGVDYPFSGGTTVFAGPSILALYKAYALEAGVLFPLYRNMKIGERKEHLRFGINLAYFFWLD
jgi:hypothetical protein